MLQIKNITKTYQKDKSIFTALDDLSFNVAQGEFLGVTGSSGSGKSTLLHTIGGLITPDSGKVLFRGEDVHSFNSHESNRYRRKHVGFVFQQFHLIPYLTLLENIKIVCTSSSQIDSVEQFLEKCSLLPLKNKYPSQLSVGEKQRTAFIRAIITKPDILLADEPTGNLDPENSRILMMLISDFHKDGGTVILVSHNQEITGYSTHLFRLEAGRIHFADSL